MSAKRNLTFRMDVEQREMLEDIAKQTKLDVSDLVRLSVEAFLEYVEKRGGKITLPLKFDDPSCPPKTPRTHGTKGAKATGRDNVESRAIA